MSNTLDFKFIPGNSYTYGTYEWEYVFIGKSKNGAYVFEILKGTISDSIIIKNPKDKNHLSFLSVLKEKEYSLSSCLYIKKEKDISNEISHFFFLSENDSESSKITKISTLLVEVKINSSGKFISGTVTSPFT